MKFDNVEIRYMLMYYLKEVHTWDTYVCVYN